MAVSMELLRLQTEIREKCDKFSELLPIDFLTWEYGNLIVN